MMTPRENLLSLLRREGYEAVPYEFMLCPSLEEEWRKHTQMGGVDYVDYFQMPWKRISDLKPDQTDTARFSKYYGGLKTGTEIDEWGIAHESSPNAMHMTRMLNPLGEAEETDEIMEYPLPTYSEAGNLNLKREADELKQRGIAAVGNMQCTIWETSWYIRGMESLMMDMIADEEMANAIFDRVTQMSLTRALLYAKAGVDILFLGDDIGMQSSTMMSEEMYLEWIWPRLKMLISEVKKVRPDILIFYHSCGYIEPFIPHLIEAGVDVLNPIQTECMDFEEIYRQYGDRLSFHGTIGTQAVMPFGTPEEVRAEVKKNLDIAGTKGGLFVAPTHLLEPEVPWENIMAYIQACKEY